MNLPHFITQYAAVEVGWEHESRPAESKVEAESEVAQNRAAGLDSYLAKRTVLISAWEATS